MIHLSDKRSIHGIWLIERLTGRNLVSRAYSGITLDMDLIAPFLSATHTFIDKASNESLKTIDTETNRYVWEASDFLLFVMVVSKGARVSHMRFILEFALDEFMRSEIPKNTDIESLLKDWHGTPQAFKKFGHFIDELISQYEETDECLVVGKSMDCLGIYSHLYRSILRVKTSKKNREKIVKRIKKHVSNIIGVYPFLNPDLVDGFGIDVLSLNAQEINYRQLRLALEELLRIVAESTKKIVTGTAYRNMIFNHAMKYVKRDLNRLTLYSITDDVIRWLF